VCDETSSNECFCVEVVALPWELTLDLWIESEFEEDRKAALAWKILLAVGFSIGMSYVGIRMIKLQNDLEERNHKDKLQDGDATKPPAVQLAEGKATPKVDKTVV